MKKSAQNEPILDYAPGSKERATLEAELQSQLSQTIEIPCLINGKEVRTGNLRTVSCPHDHSKVLAQFHLAGEAEMLLAAEGAMAAQKEWETVPLSRRQEIFLKAADLVAGPYRAKLNAATMLGQSKSVYQAEIDSACELADFLRFNAQYAEEMQLVQPLSTESISNRLEYRGLEGFVLAITPFNFTAIAGNLPSCSTLFGNVSLWKPSDTQVLSAWYTLQVFKEAGFPDGVIQFIPADGPLTSRVLVPHPSLAGIHFTGSTATFRSLWQSVASQIHTYRSYPRLVGETGGKDFVFAHPSADERVLIAALVRGAFEYQGQKCSAASRAYIPQSVWNKISDQLISEIKSIRMGDVIDFKNFMNAVIDARSFKKISGYLERAHATPQIEILAGGKGREEGGYFIEPTLLKTSDPFSETMKEEIFGPVLTVFVYPDSDEASTLRACNEASPYALTGGIIAQDEAAIKRISLALRHAAGNLYINDKPTGAVVGQQPFGGGRASGTNDKAGSMWNLIRWVSPLTIKTNLKPATDYRYPFMK